MWDMAGERVEVDGVRGSMFDRICGQRGILISMCGFRRLDRAEEGGENRFTLRIVSVAAISFE